MRRSFSLLCLIALALVGKGASAAAEGNTEAAAVSLVLDSNDVLPACLSADRLAAGVQKRLGRDVFGATSENGKIEAKLSINVRMALVGFQVWDVELTTSQRPAATAAPISGRRLLRLKAPSCEDLLAPLTLIITLTIDPTAVSTPPPAPAPPPLIVAPKAVIAPSKPWTFSMLTGLGVGFGALPGAAVGVQLGGLTRREGWPAFALTLGYQGASSTFTSADTLRKGKASFSLWNVGIDVRPRLWRFVHGVASLRCQVVSAEGSGFDRNQSSTTYSCSNGAGLLSLVPVSPQLSLFVKAQLDVSWQRSRYVFSDGASQPFEGFRSSPLNADVATGLIFAF